MTIEQLWDIEPDPDPTPIRRGSRRQAQEHPDDWQKGQDQYERHLDRLGGEDR